MKSSGNVSLASFCQQQFSDADRAKLLGLIDSLPNRNNKAALHFGSEPLQGGHFVIAVNKQPPSIFEKPDDGMGKLLVYDDEFCKRSKSVFSVFEICSYCLRAGGIVADQSVDQCFGILPPMPRDAGPCRGTLGCAAGWGDWRMASARSRRASSMARSSHVPKFRA